MWPAARLHARRPPRTHAPRPRAIPGSSHPWRGLPDAPPPQPPPAVLTGVQGHEVAARPAAQGHIALALKHLLLDHLANRGALAAGAPAGRQHLPALLLVLQHSHLRRRTQRPGTCEEPCRTLGAQLGSPAATCRACRVCRSEHPAPWLQAQAGGAGCPPPRAACLSHSQTGTLPAGWPRWSRLQAGGVGEGRARDSASMGWDSAGGQQHPVKAGPCTAASCRGGCHGPTHLFGTPRWQAQTRPHGLGSLPCASGCPCQTRCWCWWHRAPTCRCPPGAAPAGSRQSRLQGVHGRPL